MNTGLTGTSAGVGLDSRTTDGSGNLDIAYTQAGGAFLGINGFDLLAIPEPSLLIVMLLAASALFLRRKRC